MFTRELKVWVFLMDETLSDDSPGTNICIFLGETEQRTVTVHKI